MLRFHDLLIDIAQLLEDEGSEGEKVDPYLHPHSL